MTSTRILRWLPLAPLLAAPLPVTAQDPSPAALLVRERVDVLVGLALREPMLVEHPSGVLFAAGYSRAPEEALDPPNLYRSDDGGRRWEQVDVGTPAQGALGNSDVDLAVGPDGALYFLTMGFDRAVGEGTHVALGVSHDVGRTWSWRYISRTRYDDRPWIGIAPDGRGHVIWNDGAGVRHAASDDGTTWLERPRIHAAGGSSHLAVGTEGRVAVRIAPVSASGTRRDEGVDFVAVSVDGGASWARRDAPGTRRWDGDFEFETLTDVPRWVEPLAWTADGRLCHLWSEGTELWLGCSSDLGVSWDRSLVVRGTEPLYYPFLVADGRAGLAATWFSGRGEALRAHVGLLRPGAGSPLEAVSDPLALDAWRVEQGQRVRTTAGEYVPVALLADGDLGVILPIQASERGDGFSWLRLSR